MGGGKGRHDRRHLWSDGGGLFGPEMNLNELQKSWKVGRIEINLESKNDRTYRGDLIPMSTDVTPLPYRSRRRERRQGGALLREGGACHDRGCPCIQAETDSGSCEGHHEGVGVPDSQRRGEPPEGRQDSTKRARVVSYGPENIRQVRGVDTELVYVVEERGDVILSPEGWDRERRRGRGD